VDVMECAAAAIRLEHDGLLEKQSIRHP